MLHLAIHPGEVLCNKPRATVTLVMQTFEQNHKVLNHPNHSLEICILLISLHTILFVARRTIPPKSMRQRCRGTGILKVQLLVMVFLSEEPVLQVANLNTIADVDVFLGSSGLLNGKSPSSHTHICHCSSISPSLKAQREPRRPSVQRFTSKQTNPGRERAPRRGDKTENMFGSRPSSNGSASSSTSSTASSSSSSSSGSSPMAFHDKQHYVCILCNK